MQETVYCSIFNITEQGLLRRGLVKSVFILATPRPPSHMNTAWLLTADLSAKSLLRRTQPGPLQGRKKYAGLKNACTSK